MSKSIRKFWVLLLAAALLLAFSAPALSATSIRVLTGWPKTSFDCEAFMKYLDALQKAADEKYPGELKVDYKGAGEVVSNREQVEALRNGLVDMVFTATSYYTSIMPEMDTLSLTQMMPSEERSSGVNDYLDSIHNTKVNAHYLGRMGTGALFYIFLNTKVENMAGLKGFRLRSSPTNIPFMKSLGVDPVGMPPTEVYTAMERGVVKGYILPPATIRDFGLVPVSKYMIDPGFYQPCQVVLVNLDFWKKLPENLKALVTDVFASMEDKAIVDHKQHQTDEINSFVKGGMQIIEFKGDERAQFLKMADDALLSVVTKKSPAEATKIKELISK